MTTESQNSATNPAALTTAQRFHFDVFGYVVLDSILPTDEIDAMKAALYRMRADTNKAAQRIYLNHEREHSIHMGNLVAYDPALTRYTVHPQLLPLIRDVVGGDVRVEETEASTNRRNPSDNVDELCKRDVVPLGLHTGTRSGWGTYFEQEKFHCLFVKTLAYLTDVGPGDGGTAVIPGSHKMQWQQAEMIAAAQADPKRLIKQVQAPAGSVILFAESLIHSTTAIWSDTERVICVTGYTPPMLREWPGNEIDPAFLESQPEDVRRVLSGSDSWDWRRNYSA